MSDQLLACVRTCPESPNLVELNRRFRWASVRLLTQVEVQISGRYVARDVFALGDSHGVYNGCLGPPPRPLVRRGKRSRGSDNRNVNELYIVGTRVGRAEVGVFLESLCGDAGCILAICRGNASVEQRVRSAAKEASRISIDDAVRDWPLLMTDERQEVLLVAVAND